MIFKRRVRRDRRTENPTVAIPQKAEGTVMVRRFQNRFECGCEWPQDVLAPEECPDHPGHKRVYVTEMVFKMENVEIQEG
jgi:hypothetical protein